MGRTSMRRAAFDSRGSMGPAFVDGITTSAAWQETADTAHWFTRIGQPRIRMRVAEVHGDTTGHALIFGEGPALEGCLVRIHSRCLFGDALGSDDCDCGPELALAMDMIHAHGSGILFYLEQEGRGAGLRTKARGYQLSQDRELNTFESFVRLGYPPDCRNYHDAAEFLQKLGLTRIRLLTNNPEKVAQLAGAGLSVQQVPLRTSPRSKRARQYLEDKRVHRGHRLPRTWWMWRIVDGLFELAIITTVSVSCVAAAQLITRTDPLPMVDIASVAFGIVAGGWVRSRTRLLQARFRLLCLRFYGLRASNVD